VTLNNRTETDLLVIGSGMTGVTAALFALNRGVKTTLIGDSGGLLFSGSLIDLMGVYPPEEKKKWDDPWAAMEALKKDIPGHPYAKLAKDDILTAFEEVTAFFKEYGYPYRYDKDRNIQMLTGMGTVKQSFCAPETMWAGIEALEKKSRVLIIDFKGFKEFSANQIACATEECWESIKTLTVAFPGFSNHNDVYAAHMARALELSRTRKELAELIKPVIGDAEAVGFPAIFGINKISEIHKDLEVLLGVPVFEIPTMPVSVPGLRTKEVFELGLQAKGVIRPMSKKVVGVKKDGDEFIAEIDHSGEDNHIYAKGILLATGRFMGKGLYADRNLIKETLFNLPVSQPETREGWHSDNFFIPQGHAINRSGIEVDDSFRPIDGTGNIKDEALFAAGTILAHNDWTRIKSGSGSAISTAFGAVKAFKKYIDEKGVK